MKKILTAVILTFLGYVSTKKVAGYLEPCSSHNHCKEGFECSLVPGMVGGKRCTSDKIVEQKYSVDLLDCLLKDGQICQDDNLC